MSPKKPTRKNLNRRLHTLWAEKVKERAGYRCEKCLREVPVLHAHHYVGRTTGRLKYDLRNGVALCPRDHMFGPESAHKGGPFFDAWFRRTRPEDYEYLMRAESRATIHRSDADLLDLLESMQSDSERMAA